MSTFQRQLGQLLRHGTHAGLADGPLLERFLAGPEEAAAAAFGTLVERHGPMVLRVCRRVLGDAHEAEDAAQAVFLVLARKARRVRRRDSVASWLFGVAVRVARRARDRNSRRRRHERRGAEMAARSNSGAANTSPDAEESPWADLYDELERLPERLRAPLVLCYLEGVTNEQAAARLGTSLRTLRRRLAEGRERLKARLERRGVGPAAAVLAATLVPETARAGVVPAVWAERTVHAALEFAARGAATGAAATMAQEVIRSMFTTKLQLVAATAVVTGTVALAGFLPQATGPAEATPDNPPPPAASTPQPDPAPAPPPAAVPVTLDGTPLPDFVTDHPRTHPGRAIQIQITSAETGEPVPRANVKVWNAINSYWTSTDEDGRISIEHSTGPADTWFTVDVWGDGLAMQRHIYGEGDEPIPDEATIRLQPGETLGGIIQDEQGRPVAGADVYLWSHNYRRKDPAELMFDLRATSGPDGRWQTSGAPETTGELIGMYVTHPDFISDREYAGGRESPPIEELRAGTTAAVLKKGPPIEGRVLDAEGNPVAGALVLTTTWPDNLFGMVKDFAVVTDADGHYRTGPLAPGDWHVIARAPGHAPAAREIKLGSAISQVELRLGPPRTLRFRVVDPAGEPIEGAFVNIDTWNRYRCLGVYLWTDAEGRAVWDSAPSDPVLVGSSLEGYLSRYRQRVEPTDEEIVVTLTPSLTIAGTVRDAETRTRIERAEVQVGTVDPATGEVVEWTKPDEARLMASDGDLDVGVAAASAPVQLRITANGYAPFVTRTFTADERAVEGYEVLLTPVEPTGQTATATFPDGTPLANARVLTAVLNQRDILIENGELHAQFIESEPEVRTGADGTFAVPPLGEQPSVVFLYGDDGYAYATADAVRESSELQAKPFARVAGRYLVGALPGANVTLQLQGRLQSEETNQVDISMRDKTTTDAEGRFAFERVIPTDDLRISREFTYGVPGSVWSTGEAVHVEPGQTVDITYGGSGQSIVGRIAPPLGWEQPVDFTETTSVLLGYDRPYRPIPPEFYRDRTEPYGQDLLDWSRAWEASPEGRAYRDATRRYQCHPFPDGSFRVDDLPPGTYRLVAYVGEESHARPRGPFAPLSHTFTIPPLPGGRAEEPLDLGLLRLRPRTTLEVGQEAPEVELTTTDGEAITIPADDRGRHLLLDFGSSREDSSRHRIAELNGLRARIDEDRLAIVSLLVDEDNAATREFIAAKGQPWPQAIIGRFPNPVVEAYAVEDQGSTIVSASQLILISPDGRVLARGRSLRDIEQALPEVP